MLQTWIYLFIDKGFFTKDGVEYACALGETDVQVFNSYDSARQTMTFRREGYQKYGYKLVDSGTGADDEDLIFWKRLEDKEGHAHVFEVHRKIVYGEVFQAGRS